MALTKCGECSGEVSDKANACPHCGNPIHIDPLPKKEVSPSIPEQIKVVGKQELFSLRRVVGMVLIGASILGLLLVILLKVPSAGISVERIISQFPSSIQAIKDLPNLISKKVFQGQNNLTMEISKILAPSQEKVTPVDPLAVQTNPDGSKTYPVQYNYLFGYEFYASKIDQTGNIDIGSEPKQVIARLFNTLGFPASLTKNLAIVNVDPTLVGSNIRLATPWAGANAYVVVSQPQGGMYGMVNNGAVIFLNNLVGYNLVVLTHELGHQIGFHMTDQEWTQYYKLRNIPNGTPRISANWSLSPNEDLAEVYTHMYSPQEVDIKTAYGILVLRDNGMMDIFGKCSSLQLELVQEWLSKYGTKDLFYSGSSISEAESAVNTDPELQKCREQNNGTDPFGKPLYVRQASEAAKQFVREIVARLK